MVYYIRMNEEKKTILIVEDDSFLVKAYQLRFEKENMEVQIATTGTDAALRLEQDPPHIVLLDLMLPGASGFDILGAIRKLPSWKNVPVIILSNLGQPEDIQRAKDLGATDYIVKANTKINDVADTVKKYL
jgi:DNA-binding response OmpR family regulator